MPNFATLLPPPEGRWARRVSFNPDEPSLGHSGNVAYRIDAARDFEGWRVLVQELASWARDNEVKIAAVTFRNIRIVHDGLLWVATSKRNTAKGERRGRGVFPDQAEHPDLL